MDIKFKIDQHIGDISRNEYAIKTYTKEVNVIRWGDGLPVLDIRNWTYMHGDEVIPGKGITLKPYEVDKLKQLLNGI